MKKTLFILCALLLTSIGASAESVDYTSNLNSGTWTWDSNNTSATNTYGTGKERYGAEIVGTVESPYKVLYETVMGLPAGTYVLTFYAVANNAWVDAAYGESIAQVYANKTTKDITVYDQTACTQSDYPHTLICTVGDDGTLEYGMQNIGTGGNWYVCEGVSLTLIDSDWTGEATAHKCTATLEDWSTNITVPGSDEGGKFQRNTWSTETDASGMVPPFIEYWVKNGVTLPTATISHTQLTGLAKGYYSVSMDIRIFSEAGNSIGEGTTFNVKGDGDTTAQSEDLDNTNQDGHEGTYNTETEVYGTYTLTATVGESSTLDISINLPETPTYNWIAWKNLDVVYMGTSLDYAIGTPTCAVSCVKPGSTVSITFPNCTTPNAGESPTLSNTNKITVNDNTVDATLSYSGTTATVTFTMPSTTAYGTTVTVSVPEGLLFWSTTEVASTAAEFTLSTPIMADQEGVYILSVYDNEFLSRGYNYGTAADVDRYGVPVNIVFGDDGTATVEYMDSKLYLYGPNWAWTDAAAANASHYTLVAVEGQEGVYQFLGGTGTAGEENYPMYVYDVAKTNNATDTQNTYRVANNGIKNDNYSDDTQTYWKILTREERDEIKDAWVLGEYQEIAASFGATISSKEDFEAFLAALGDGTDATTSVTNAELTSVTLVDTEGTYGWSISYPTSGSGTFNSDTYCTELFESSGDLYQNVDGLEPGLYKVTLQGFIRHGWYDTCIDYKDYDLSYAFLRANDYEINLVPWAWEATLDEEIVANSTPNTRETASTAFEAGKYLNTLYTIVGDDGSLLIEIDSPGTFGSEWVAVKNLTLTYYGNQDVITWEMTSAGYGTIILPFDAEIPTADDNGNEIEWTAYSTGTVTLDDDESGNATLSLNEVTADGDSKITLKANTPYIMAGTAGTYTFTGTPQTATNNLTEGKLTGTFVDMDYDALMTAAGENTVYLLQNHEGEVAFYPVVEDASSAATLTPYHCYLTLTDSDLKTTSAPAKLSFSFGGEATGIVAVEGAEAEGNDAIYDLSGRKVSKAVKGVYIQNGKKVLVK